MEKKQAFIINVTYFAFIAALAYVGVNYLLGIVGPFILGFIFAYFALAIVRKVFKDDRRSYRALTLFCIYALIILLAALVIGLGINKTGDFIKTLPVFYKNTIDPYINSLEATLVELGESLPESISSSLSEMTDTIFDSIKSLLSTLASSLVNVTTVAIKNTPNVLVSVMVTIISSFYFVFDYEELLSWLDSAMSDSFRKTFNEIKDFIQNTLLKILVSYLTIMGITFVELFIGLTLIRISNSGMWAFIIAFLDILPVLGVGTVLIPWGLSSIITGKVGMGIALLVLYVVIAMIRNIIEPRFVGTDLGLHPLATLCSMLIGIRFFGAIGMFGLPLTLSFFYTRSKKQDLAK